MAERLDLCLRKGYYAGTRAHGPRRGGEDATRRAANVLGSLGILTLSSSHLGQIRCWRVPTSRGTYSLDVT